MKLQEILYSVKRILLKIFIGFSIISVILFFWWLTGYNFDTRNLGVALSTFVSVIIYIIVYKIIVYDCLKLHLVFGKRRIASTKVEK